MPGGYACRSVASDNAIDPSGTQSCPPVVDEERIVSPPPDVPARDRIDQRQPIAYVARQSRGGGMIEHLYLQGGAAVPPELTDIASDDVVRVLVDAQCTAVRRSADGITYAVLSPLRVVDRSKGVPRRGKGVEQWPKTASWVGDSPR